MLMLSAIAMPLFAAALFLIFSMYWLKQNKTTREVTFPKYLRLLQPKNGKLTSAALIRIAAFTAAGEIILFTALWAVIRFGMYTEGRYVPAAVLFLTAAVPFAGLLLHCFMPCAAGKGVKLLGHLSVFLAVLLLTEVCVFNAKSFTASGNAYTLSMDEITPLTDNSLTLTDGEYVITGDIEFELTGIPEGTRGIILRMDQERTPDSRLVHAWIDMKDDNFQYSYIITSDKFTMAYDTDPTFSIDPYGRVHSLLLHFNCVSRPVTLHEIVAVSALPFTFSGARWLLLSLLGLIVLSVTEYRLYQKTYTRSRRQRIIAAAAVILCTCSTLFYWRPEQEMIEYRKGDNYDWCDPYIQTFDAFQKGQVWLDLPDDPGLAELENLYDNSERRENEVAYRWDLAYKDGKYYSYFGVTPVLTLYYPLYLLTGELPAVPITVDVFGTLSALLLCLTILAAVRLMVKKPNFLLLLLSMPAAICCCGIYFCLQCTDKYYVAVISGMFFLLLSLWLGLRGCSIKHMGRRFVMFFLSGTALAFCAGARPTMAVSAALLLPFFFGILLRRSELLSMRLAQAGCFLVPLAAGIGGLMAYNYARFGSPLDFGATYQLTVSDVHANGLRLSLLPSALQHYFLQKPIMRASFPFFETVNFGMRCYGRYIYTDACYGALAVPGLLLGTLLLPAAFRRGHMQTTPGISTLQKRAALAVCFAVPVFVAWADLCMGGVNQRYITDILPLLTIGMVLVLLRTTDIKAHAYRYGISIAALLLSIGMIWLLMIGMRDCPLLLRCPELYDTAEEMLIFWH